MPTTTPFTALGRGNGFSFCPTKVDVSGFDHWVTLGGVSSGSASAAKINTSLANCMKLYWNTELVKTSVDAQADNAGSSVQINTQNFEHKIMKPDGEALEPRGRACKGSVRGLTLNESTTPGAESCNAIVSFKLNPVRMYNGDTTDINNFVGFGLSNLIEGLCNASHFDGLLDANVQTNISSYLDGTTESGTSTEPNSITAFNKVVHDFTVDSIPFKAFNQAFMSSTRSSPSPTFVNQATKVSASETDGSVHSDAEIDLGTNLSLSSYTYS